MTGRRTRNLITGIISVLLACASGHQTLIAQQNGKVPARNEIDGRYMWDLTDLFTSDEKWEASYRSAEESIGNFTPYAGKLGTSGRTLLACLKLNDEVGIQMGRLNSYASRKRDQDLGNTSYQAMFQRMQSLLTKRSTASAFIEPEILSINDEKLNGFLREDEALGLYRHYLDDLRRRRDHILSREEKELLSLTYEVTNGYYSAFGMLTNADFEWGNIRDEEDREAAMSQGRYFLYMTSPDRRVRHDAYKELYVPFEKHLNTLTALLTAKMKTDVFYMKARGYDSSLESALSGPNIPVQVYQNLIGTLNENLGPLHRWAAMKKRLLGVDALHPYDTYAPIFPEIERKYTYEEAQGIIKEALKPLGDEVQKILDSAFTDRWIDVYENVGKRGGAYSSGTYGVHPYILMNFDGTLGSVSTLAHELGHTIHTYLSHETQPYIYSGYANFNAEVASTTNEALLIDYLLDHAGTDDERLSLLQAYIQKFGSTFYRQGRFAEFELAVHKKVEKDEPLTHEALSSLFGDLYQKYWGPDMVVDEEEKFSWSRIPPFYYNYYVYTYATSFAASQMIAKKIREEGQPAVENYLRFLSSGSSDYPIELLTIAGVDLSTPAPIEAATARMNELLDRMEEIIAGN